MLKLYQTIANIRPKRHAVAGKIFWFFCQFQQPRRRNSSSWTFTCKNTERENLQLENIVFSYRGILKSRNIETGLLFRKPLKVLQIDGKLNFYVFVLLCTSCRFLYVILIWDQIRLLETDEIRLTPCVMR